MGLPVRKWKHRTGEKLWNLICLLILFQIACFPVLYLAVGYQRHMHTEKLGGFSVGSSSVVESTLEPLNASSYPPIFSNLASIMEGECCPGTLSSLYPPSALDCKFMLPFTELLHRPYPPTHLPGTASVCLLDNEWFEKGKDPIYSVLLPIFNSSYRLRVIVTQLLKLTSGPWELLIHADGVTDDSLEIVHAVIREYHTWPLCETPMEDLDVRQAWQSVHNIFIEEVTNSAPRPILIQGEIGRPCRYFPRKSLVHVSVTVAEPPGILATAANNIGMRAARGRYLVLVDDDQIMTTPSWNEKLARPFEQWPDVFSMSMRCAHSYGGPTVQSDLVGAKCTDTSVPQPDNPCSVWIRDSGNRGPLMVRATYARQIGFLDEVNFMGFLTTDCDHDFNHRAFYDHGWVSGHMPIHYTEERCCRTPISSLDDSQKLEALKTYFHHRRDAFGIIPKAYNYTRRFETRNLCS